MEKMTLITHPDAVFSEEKIYCFKKSFTAKNPISFSADVFADTRYKLYLNDKLISVGPCRGNQSDMYYNTLSHNADLRDGENTLTAVVLQLKNEFDGGEVYANLGGVTRTGNLRFALKGTITCKDGNVDIETDDTWDSAFFSGLSFVNDPDYSMGMNESIEASYFSPFAWKAAKTVENCILYGKPQDNVFSFGRYTVLPAPIPPQRLEPVSFSFDDKGVCDAGEHMTAYLKFAFSGKGTIRLTYAECKYVERDGKLVKEDRTAPDGIIHGYSDVIEVDGNCIYEPFWFRTFRFIKAEITGDVKIEKLEGWETGYDLNVKGSFTCDSEEDNELWKISLRTLKRCLHESYTDCPYYEQLQYLMDTRMQGLYTYYVSGDDRGILRTFRDFASVQRADGIIYSSTPGIIKQIIPGFALYYLFMLYDHYMYFADKSVLESYLPVAARVLNYFSKNLSDRGLVKRSGFWDFVDWADGWEGIYGFPPGDAKEEMTIYTLMYATALKRAAVLQNALGNYGSAQAYEEEAQAISQSAKQYCFDHEKMLFADGPDKKYYSTHAQIWAVLSGTVSGEEATRIMKNSLSLVTQPTYCYSYDYFRALEMCGLYEERKTMFDSLRNLLSLHCTTIPEEIDNPRSDCHGWGAIALYEFTASDLGIRVDEPSHTLYVKPYIHEFKHVKGTVVLSRGEAHGEWCLEGNTFSLKLSVPKGYTVQVTMPNGSVHETTETELSLSCQI